MGYWLGITFSCLDVLCVAVFCDAFLERKTRGLRFVVGALLCGVLSYIATIFVSHISEESPITLLKFAALITVYFVFASLFYLGKFWMRLLVVLLAYAIFTLLEFCVLYSLLALLHIRYDEYVANMKFYLASAAITYSLKFLLSSGIKKIHKPMVASSASIKWAPLTIGFPLISLVGISICYYLSMNGKIAAAFVLFSSGILLVTNAVILILIDLTEKNNLAQEQQKTLNEQLRSQRANIDALSSAYATQRKMTHDFRHHIAALSGMLQGGETQQAQDYLAALQEQQTERALMVNTHNSVIDAVLNQKGYAAQKQHIDIQFEVNDLSPLQIELIDCTVVLGNLLDNAIEACLKLEEAKRRIEVSVLRDEAYADGDAKLYVSIINTSLPVHIEKDCIATTKLEPHLHGFGLPCAKELLRRNTPFTRWIIMTVRSNSALNGPMWPAILAFTHEFLSLAQDSLHFSLVCGRIRAKDDKEMPMEQIAKELTQYFLAHGLIKEDDAEVCQYALYRHISRAVGLIALTLLGGLITDFGSAFCFTVSFLFLRERTGGYHAKTEWQCALYSAAMIFATMFALPIFAEEPNNYWAIMIASSALIWVSSPADNKQIHLSRAESKAMAKRARLRLLLLDAVSLALLGVHGHLFVSSIALAELSVAVSLMMATAGFGIQ